MELSSQAFVRPRCFRLLPFRAQIVVWAPCRPVFHLWSLDSHRIERPKRRLHDKNDLKTIRKVVCRCGGDSAARTIADARHCDDSSRAAAAARSNRQHTPKADWIAETLVLQARNARRGTISCECETATVRGKSNWRGILACTKNRASRVVEAGADVSRA
jgi:hypothetical protein